MGSRRARRLANRQRGRSSHSTDDDVPTASAYTEVSVTASTWYDYCGGQTWNYNTTFDGKTVFETSSANVQNFIAASDVWFRSSVADVHRRLWRLCGSPGPARGLTYDTVEMPILFILNFSK